MNPVDGVILAAGLSSRMSRPKPLLEVGDVTFLERAANTLRGAGCRAVYVVVNAAAEDVAEAARALGLDVVTNPQAESEQIDSLRCAVAVLPEDSAALVMLPVDLPLVTPDTAAAVVRLFTEEDALLVLPFHKGVAGHPVLLSRPLYGEILHTPFEEGVRSLIMSHARDLREVKVNDPGILIDIDTPDDYSRFVLPA